MPIYMLFIILLTLSSCVSLFLIIHALHRYAVPGALAFAFMLSGAFVWSSGYLGELLAPTLAAKIAWDNFQFLGSDILVAGALLFALDYTGRGLLIRRFGWLLGVQVLMNQILIWMNPFHHLLRLTVELDTHALFPVLTYTYGPWFWCLVVYHYLLAIGLCSLLLVYALQSQLPYRLQAITILAAMVVPFFGTLLTVSGMVPIPGMQYLDITPITFGIANLMLAWALFRHRLIDLAPIARTLLVEQMPDGMIVLDAQQRIVDCNPAALRLLGCSARMLIGSSAPAALPLFGSLFTPHPVSSSAPILLPHINDTASPVYVTLITTPLVNRRHRLIGWLALFRDVSAQQHAEVSLHESQALLQGVLDYSPYSIAVGDTTGRFLIANRRFASIAGLSDPQQVQGKACADLLPPELARIGDAVREQALRTQAPQMNEVSWQSHGGLHTGLVSTFPLKHPDGTIYAVGSISNDITERKRAEQVLDQYRQIVSITPDSISLIDPQYVYQVVNQAYLFRLNRDYDQIVGHTVAEVMGADVFENVIQPRLDRCLSGETVCYQAWFTYPGAGQRFMDVTYTPYRHEGMDICGILVSARDMTDVKLAEEAYRVLVDHSLQGFGIVQDGQVVFSNPAAAQITGYTGAEIQLMGAAHLDRIVHPDDRQRLQHYHQVRVQGQQVPLHYEYRIICKDGTVRWLDNHSVPIQYQGRLASQVTFIDITERKRIEADLQATQARLNLLLESSPAVIFSLHIGTDYQATYVSPNVTMLTGFQPEDFTSNSEFWSSRMHPDDLADVSRRAVDFANQHYRGGEYRFQHRDGSYRWMRDEVRLVYGTNGQPELIGYWIDITSQRVAEEALAEREATLRAFYDSAPFRMGIVELHTDDVVFFDVNAAFAQEFGTTPEYICGRLASDLARETGSDITWIAPWISYYYQAWESDQAVRFEINEHPSDESVWISVAVAPIKTPTHRFPRCCFVTEDITERKRAEQALQESEARYRTLARHFPNGTVLLFDRDLRYMVAGGTALACMGFTPEMLEGRTIWECIPPDICAVAEQLYRSVLDGTAPPEIEQVYGDCVYRSILEPIRDPQGSIIAGMIISLDITAQKRVEAELEQRVQERTVELVATNQKLEQQIAERKQAEIALARTYAHIEHLNAQLQRSNLLLRTLFDNLQNGLGLVDHTGLLLTINQPLASLYGHLPQHMVAQPWNMFCPFSPPLVEQTFHTKQAHYSRERYIDTSGRSYMLDFAVLPVINDADEVEQAIVHVIDVTDRLQLEAQVIAQERFAANGWLAATVAHEVNSPLQAIESCLHMAGRTQGNQHAEYLQLARDEIRRIARILHQLLDLYRPESSINAALNMNQLIERELLLLGRTLAKQGIKVEQNLAADLPGLWGRADELMQVLLNLIVNAMHAMPYGGDLHIQTFCKHPEEGVDLRDQRLVITITDTGIGIAPEFQKRIFDPFFTTKSSGTGLGLTISAKIVAEHGGFIQCHSTPDTGTTFVLEFPLHEHAMQQHNGCNLPLYHDL